MLENNKKYTLSEFCRILKESQEFKAKKGKNVDREDKKNNDKSVNDILKQTKEYDGGFHNKTKREDPRNADDFNKTTIENDYTIEPNKEYKARVKALVHGFNSEENQKNSKIEKENKGVDFEGNKKFFKEREEVTKKRSNRKEALKKSGLQSKELAKDKEFDEEFKDKTIFNENKKMKRLHFNKTVFLNESEMLNKIPNDMKVDGNKFLMKDSAGNEYLIECVKDKAINDIIHTNVLDYKNKEKFNEELNRMKELYGYKANNNVQNDSKYENNMVSKMLSESKKKLFETKENDNDKFFSTVLGI